MPKDPSEREAFKAVRRREVRAFRHRPSFIIGMAMVLISLFGLVYLVADVLSRLVILVGIFGAALVYDIVTRHFYAALCRRDRSTDTPSYDDRTA